MTKQFIILLTAGFLLTACQSNESNKQTPVVNDSTPATSTGTELSNRSNPDLSGVKLDADNDPVCGMPAKNYTTDTAHHRSKVYGFCAKECKEAFLKNPESYLVKK